MIKKIEICVVFVVLFNHIMVALRVSLLISWGGAAVGSTSIWPMLLCSYGCRSDSSCLHYETILLVS